MKALFDTNLLIDYLQGVEAVRAELRLYGQRLVSRITWMELLCGARSAAEEAAARECLAGFGVAEITPEVAEEAVRLRKQHHLKLPDAIVWATSRTLGCLLVTLDTRDFPATDPGVRIPYQR